MLSPRKWALFQGSSSSCTLMHSKVLPHFQQGGARRHEETTLCDTLLCAGAGEVVALQMHGELSGTWLSLPQVGVLHILSPSLPMGKQSRFHKRQTGQKGTHRHTLQREKMTIFRGSHPTQQIKRKVKQPLLC